MGEGESVKKKKKKKKIRRSGEWEGFHRKTIHLDKVVAQIIRSVKHFRKDEDRKKQ